jgi:hypothetical protein
MQRSRLDLARDTPTEMSAQKEKCQFLWAAEPESEDFASPASTVAATIALNLSTSRRVSRGDDGDGNSSIPESPLMSLS